VVRSFCFSERNLDVARLTTVVLGGIARFGSSGVVYEDLGKDGNPNTRHNGYQG
jgi:hypothetical protein